MLFIKKVIGCLNCTFNAFQKKKKFEHHITDPSARGLCSLSSTEFTDEQSIRQGNFG